jgi:hypothetical protein
VIFEVKVFEKRPVDTFAKFIVRIFEALAVRAVTVVGRLKDPETIKLLVETFPVVTIVFASLSSTYVLAPMLRVFVGFRLNIPTFPEVTRVEHDMAFDPVRLPYKFEAVTDNAFMVFDPEIVPYMVDPDTVFVPTTAPYRVPTRTLPGPKTEP